MLVFNRHQRLGYLFSSFRHVNYQKFLIVKQLTQQRRRQWRVRGPPPSIKSGPLARGLARHNKRFTTEEIIKIVATRCQILSLKCTKSFVGWGSAPDPAEGAYSAPQTPSWILGAYF